MWLKFLVPIGMYVLCAPFPDDIPGSENLSSITDGLVFPSENRFPFGFKKSGLGNTEPGLSPFPPPNLTSAIPWKLRSSGSFGKVNLVFVLKSLLTDCPANLVLWWLESKNGFLASFDLCSPRSLASRSYSENLLVNWCIVAPKFGILKGKFN